MHEAFKALADPTRRKILDLLKEQDLTAGEIANHFQVSKPSISQHLKLLKAAHLVHDEKKGQFVYYSLNLTIFQELLSWTMGFFEKGGKQP
ncbi:transcriptional regulator [Shouchella clausii]|uniref:autorepressor SdpR family transcription factor n=1 Tax=Shouchella clausii TaxID=79880 RepID=UPI000BA4FFB8|nr:autorepressor SdpR family transcription factor [Shouchella clausii]PAF13744.1 transcriptional regulator [Shouchella clausii]